MEIYLDDTVKTGISVSHDSRYKNDVTYPHYHNTYELYYLTRGSARYFINDTTFEISAGDVVLIPPKTIHKTTYLETDAERLLVVFDKDFLSIKDDDPIYDCFKKQYHYKNVMLREIFTTMEHAYAKNNEKQNRLIQYALLYILMKLSVGHFEKESIDTIPNSERPFLAAVEYINNNFSENLTLEEIAEKFHVSKSHFSRKFKEITGIGFNEYILLVRIKHSELLLMETNLSVTEISGKCGFNSSCYFTSVFKKYKGMTPFKFRKK